MLRARTIKTWYGIHKWTSLVCTAFLLMLCVTGLPLIFHEEIDHLTGRRPQPAEMPAGTPPADLDRIAAAARAEQPDEKLLYLSWDEHDPLVYATTAPTVLAGVDDMHFIAYDARTAEKIDAPPLTEGFMWIIYKLHIDLYAELPGMLFLGFMGLLFVTAVVSGIVLYGPFMRKLDFGTVRTDRARRLRWLDLHNLLGVVTLAWVLVVGLTGIVNTLSTPIRSMWQAGQLAEMTAPYRDKPPIERLSSVDAAVATARRAAPEMEPSFVAFPGTLFTSKHHFAIFMRGTTALTARLLKPALIDAETGALTDMRTMPWYVTALFVSQPLHFGDYGGLPLKFVWALLDIATIVVLGSGLYLWLARRRTPMEVRIAEFERMEADALARAEARG